MIKDGEPINNAGASLYRVGMGLSIVIGTVPGIAMAWWKPVNALIGPIVEVFYPLPSWWPGKSWRAAARSRRRQRRRRRSARHATSAS